MVRRLFAGLCLVITVVGCGTLASIGRPGAGTYPDACDDWSFPDRQCEAIVDQALRQSAIDPDDLVRVWLLPFEREATLGGGQIAQIGLELADGTIPEQEIWCVGVSVGPACNPDAEIWVSAGVDHDVPCSGEAPEGCATLPPTPPASAIDAARPLEVAVLRIPIDHAGAYEIEVGRATLANGYLLERSMSLTDRQPADYWIDEGIRLEVRPDDPARPPVGSVYREPFDGPEPVTVFVVFEVTDFEAEATLELRDIVVR